jgi:hypothetical protein
MYSYFSDLQVELLARGVLEPGEQLTGKTVTKYMPWWAFGFVNRTYLVLTTDRRVILLDHRMTWLHQALNLRAVESLPWAQVQEMVMKGIFTKKIRLRGQTQSGVINLTMKVPNQFFGLLAPMRGNMDGARAVVGAFSSQRGLMGQQAPASFPMAQQPAQMGAFAPQQMLPPASQQYYPPQNAPGYASVPPPSQQPPSQQFGAPSMPPPLPPGRFPQA